MLCRVHMKNCAILAVTAILGAPGAASAGVYLGLGVGTKPTVNDAMQDVGEPSSGSRLGVVGLRLANLSLEGAVGGFDMATQRGGDRTLYQASAALKLNLPVAGPVEGFARGGLERTWLDMGDDRYNLRGDGFLAGVGLELRWNLVLASVSVLVDYTIHRASLESEMNKVDLTSHVVGVGLQVGIF